MGNLLAAEGVNSWALRTLVALRSALAGDAEAVHEVKSLASRYQPHGLAVRHMLGELAPALLPSWAEDFDLWISELLLDLDRVEKVLLLAPKNKSVRRFRVETLWALGVAWRHPAPPVVSQEVEARLLAAGCLPEISALIAGL